MFCKRERTFLNRKDWRVNSIPKTGEQMSRKPRFLFKETDAQFPTIQKRVVTLVDMQIKNQEVGHALLESIYTDHI